MTQYVYADTTNKNTPPPPKQQQQQQQQNKTKLELPQLYSPKFYKATTQISHQLEIKNMQM